ncbi:hypothetical protein FQN54_006414 [Arachnomyces sp. PD_36]|nr:hypothetical protein FQN54_006414 [Arachnomyces sp. PD_36]
MEDAAVAQFTEITGSPPHLAAQYLQLTDYNVETAMQLYFENGGAEIGPAASEPSAPPPVPPQSSRPPGFQAQGGGVINIDSDDDESDLNDAGITGYNAARSASASRDRSGAADGSPGSRLFEDDAAMARRLQEEMYGGAANNQGGAGFDEDGVRAPMARTTETLVGPGAGGFDDDEGMHEAVMRQMQARQNARQRNRPGIFNQTGDATSSIWANGTSSSHQEELARATGGASQASSKSSMLAEMYRPPFEIMSKLSWDPAREEGREEERWLLVNIQDPSVFDCQVLNRDLWKNPSVMDTIKENFIFLQFAKDDPRGSTYIQYYFPGHDSQDNYPHIAIVDPRTGEQVKVWSGPPVIQAGDFLIQLHEFLDRYSLKHNAKNPVAKRKPEVKPEKKIEAMTDEEMMEMALKNSLAGQSPSRQEDPDDLTRSFVDTKGKGKAKETEGDSDDDMDIPDAGEDEELQPSNSLFQSIPSDHPQEEPAPGPGITRIQFRHPSGRVIRRFALSDPVLRIYEWLKASPLEGKEGVEFELVSMGKNLIDSLESTIEDAKLGGATVMIGFVED